ncbi:MAG: hypothetical protein IJD82_00580, partial [Clostridia bacterium]|nr:hypothetical protein [Clostridia bacterium]
MKKTIIGTLLLALVLSVLTGCSEEIESSDLNIFSEASYDNESKFVPEQSADASEEVSENSEAPTGEFVVKDKKYTFEGNDLVLISVDNQTAKNYSVTITGKYLDAEGKTLRTETQTFDQYSAGYSNYFLFKPNMKFDKFTYEIKTKETDGPFYAKHVSVRFNRLVEGMHYIFSECDKGNWEKFPSVSDSASWAYTG